MVMNATLPSSYSAVIGLRYHSQDKSSYCGAAVAQMLLRPFKPTLDDQNELANQNSGNNDPANGANGVTVNGLVKTLAQHGVKFVGGSPTEPFAAAAAALTRTRAGVAALIPDGGELHWIALNGGVLDGTDPSLPRGFYVHNPHVEGARPPIEHSDDDACGSGGTFGIANEYVTVRGMRALGKVPLALIYAAGSEPVALPHGTRPPILLAKQAAYACGHPLDPRDCAVRGIEAEGIALKPPLDTILGNGFRAVTSRSFPLYHQVQLEADAGLVGWAFVAVDDGALLAVAVAPGESMLAEPSTVLAELRAGGESLKSIPPEFARALQDQPEMAEASDFWRVCREAPSPSHPLVRVMVGGKLLYRSRDGRFHDALHVLD